MRFDVLFKDLFRESDGILSRMLFGEVMEWPNVELPEVRNLRVDLLARGVDGVLRQVEVQVRNEAEMPFRMLEYAVALQRVYQEPVEQTVLYVGREPLRMENAYVSDWTRHEYRILNLREMDGEELLASEDWADNEWALLARTDPERVIGVVMRRLQQLSGFEQEKAAFTFAMLGGIIGMEEELKRRLRSMPIDLLENKVFGPVLREKLAEGVAKGKVEGRIEGRYELLVDLLTVRFGELPEWARLRIYSAGPDAQKGYALRLHQVSSLEELLGRA